jgi:hypothetical protein
MNIVELKKQVLKEMRNPEVYLNEVVKYVEENLEDAFNICCRKNLSINEKYPDSRYKLQLGQKTVFLTVRMFDLWETAVVEVLSNVLSKKFKDIEVKAVNDPMGDLEIVFPNKEEMRWEIKSSQAPNYFTGATHSASKCNNYILINYEINRSLKLRENQRNSNFITKMAVIIWNDMETKWLGEPSKHSSFTQLKIPSIIARERPNIVVVGKLIPKKKWCWIERKNLIKLN